ncbi:protein lifeguard 1 [Daphnia magna]|uniref:protein lifeguard 1 n=1 Tax=Daphnia magna TaxID=35525 RepID=UPI001E1BAE04|nr:protein lifeguard 1 [Daphnia magna]
MLVSGEIHHHTGNIRYSMFSPSNHAVEHSNELSNENSILVDNDMSDSKSYSSFRSAFPPTNETQDENHAFSPGVIDNSFSFSEKTIRMAFIRKVYAILMVQLAVTMGCIAVFVFVQPIALYSKGHPQLMIGALVMSIVLLIPLICCIDFRRRWPLNIIMLGTFTLCEGFLLGSLSSHYDSKEVLVAAGICTAVCLALTLFSMQTKWDFTAMGGILLALVVVLLMAGIVAICVRGKIMQIIYASLGALVFSAYLVFDTQLMLGGKHKYSISPEEYIFAALNLYLDIVNIFIYVLALVGGSK